MQAADAKLTAFLSLRSPLPKCHLISQNQKWPSQCINDFCQDFGLLGDSHLLSAHPSMQMCQAKTAAGGQRRLPQPTELIAILELLKVGPPTQPITRWRGSAIQAASRDAGSVSQRKQTILNPGKNSPRYTDEGDRREIRSWNIPPACAHRPDERTDDTREIYCGGRVPRPMAARPTGPSVVHSLLLLLQGI